MDHYVRADHRHEWMVGRDRECVECGLDGFRVARVEIRQRDPRQGTVFVLLADIDEIDARAMWRREHAEQPIDDGAPWVVSAPIDALNSTRDGTC
ncbi:hypothetical protein CRM94_17235 [Burkholderia gladioli]|uniref:Uncharacterized protein n=1 Tax=Burkholderia gladioli TaxID=28095 RepID=A0A2A7S9X2_BURGA|nr:hypothetical protein CRM94_17235 [Burkholderia gladioli]